MPENLPATTQSVPPRPGYPDYRAPAPPDPECRNDLHCRIDALQKIVSQLLLENQRLRSLVHQG